MEIPTIKAKKEIAQKIIKEIKEEGNFNTDYKIKRDKDHIFIPIKDIKKTNQEIVYLKDLEKQKKIGLNLKEILLKDKIDISKVPSSYDIVGDIIILKIEDKAFLEKNKELIGKALTKIHPHIKVILNKKKEHHGEFRTQDLDYVYGEKRKETTIKENNCILKTDVEKVFFSTRLVTERKRISKQVKKNEVVGVFFAGAGPFAIEIEKLSSPKEIVAIELNPVGVKYLLKNIKLNKMDNKIKVIEGDVEEVSKRYKNYFNRICMPLPKSAETFLDQAIFSIKNKGIVHLYSFESKNEPYKRIKKILIEKEEKNNCKIKIKEKKIVRSFSATTVQIVLDLEIIF